MGWHRSRIVKTEQGPRRISVAEFMAIALA